MQLNVIWSAPYSYSGAPIELMISGIKFKDLNSRNLSTGKRVSELLFILIM